MQGWFGDFGWTDIEEEKKTQRTTWGATKVSCVMSTSVYMAYCLLGLSSQQLHPRGMLCYVLSVLPHQCSSSEVYSIQNYSRVRPSNFTEFVSASLWLNIFVPSLQLCHVNDDSSTNLLTNWGAWCTEYCWNRYVFSWRCRGRDRVGRCPES